MNITSKRIVSWLQLSRTPGIGPLKGWALIRQFGDIDMALERLPKKPTITQIEDELSLLDKKNFWVISRDDDNFPRQLTQIPDCPLVLYGKGNQSILCNTQIAIVGARNASFISKKIAEYFAQELGKNRMIITSGLAKGIDAAAHGASLETGTIAVMAGGVDHIYPAFHRDLYEKITQKGAVISEMPLHQELTPYLFPKRNRIIAGLSRGIVVVEAALHSGSLHTAKSALEYGREIFAVPGSPMDPRCRGTNNLIKQGAYLVESAHDVLDIVNASAYRPMKTQAPQPIKQNCLDENHPSSLRQSILNELSSTPISFDDLAQSINASISQLSTEISLLEIEGLIARDHDLLIKI